MLVRWPYAVEEQVPLRVDGVGDAPALEDSLGAFRHDAVGQWCRLLVDSSSLIPKGKYRASRIVSYWVAHVVAQLTAQSVTTVVVSKAGDVVFSPLTRGEAMHHLCIWLLAWRAGMCRPLPFAPAAAFEWLTRHPAPLDSMSARGETEVSAGSDMDEADSCALRTASLSTVDAVRKVYEGAGEQRGEVNDSPYLQAVYPNFLALTRTGEFFSLAQAWLRPMRVALYVNRNKNKTAPTGQEAEDV
jgi:exodeoxyribonuclease V gamma subunit